MSSPELQTHFRSQACSRQWRGFLRALAQEFAAELSTQDMALLMARIGRRFAGAHPIGVCATLEQVQDAVNQIWDRMEWGYARLEEQADRVDVLHVGSPLQIAMAAEACGADGFLEGVYHGWFEQAGMLAGLGIRTLPVIEEDVRRFVLCPVG
jgi:hypothetical protein